MITVPPFPRATLLIWVVTLLCAVMTATAANAQLIFGDSDQPDLDPATVRSIFSYSSAAPGRTYDAAVIVTVAQDWHINSPSPYQDWLIPAEIDFGSNDALSVGSISFPEAHDVMLMDELMSVYSGEVVVRLQVSVAADAPAGEHILPIRFTSQACNNRLCLPPQTVAADLTIPVGAAGVPINPEVFSETEATGAGPEVTVSPDAEQSDLKLLIDRYGFWGYFLALGLAFVTGVLLSFSPCTYPMVPITVSIFAGQQRTIVKGFLLSLVYVGSMAVAYGVMGLVVSLVGGVFGAWLASPPVVIAIAIVLVIFALSMFGLYELQVPSWVRQKLGSKRGGGGIGSTVVLGVVAALVVSPCVGPFVAGILLYIATAGSPLIGFLVLFVFAVGLGTLYIIIGTFSNAINKLPGAGEWMESVKKFFGFVLLLMALYFLQTIISSSLSAILAGLILIALGVFGGGLDRLTPDSSFFPRLKKFIGVLALVVGIYLLGGALITQGLILPPAGRWLPVVSGSADTDAQHQLIDWETDLQNGLNRARAENKPVLIDTWATWCVNCRVLERRTFNQPAVAKEAERFIPIKVQLETAGSDVTKGFMRQFGMTHYSLPTTLLIDSDGQVQKIIKGVIGPDEMVAHMKQVH